MNLVPQWIIEQKRDGKALPSEVIREWVAAYGRGDIPDYQMAALAMAIYFKGMTFEETTALTDAMMRSGDVLDWSGLPCPTADKHSTGGIGDKISIPLAPLVAACGVAVPMISGRGLGITGGTLDKLDSIPGYDTRLSVDRFRAVMDSVGCSIIGQTDRLAPVDKKLYALRDVTGTVPSIPLIAASIMSKKLAEGAQSLVLDVKVGVGAFMKTLPEARQLAETMIAIGKGMGRNIAALLTAMDQPLGRTAGNALEIAESIDILKGQGPDDVRELTLRLGERMLALSGMTDGRATPSSASRTTDIHPPSTYVARLGGTPSPYPCTVSCTPARRALEEALSSGKALDTFRAMVAAHGGDVGIIDNPQRLAGTLALQDVLAPQSGTVTHVSADAIGRIVLLLGGGRRKTTDTIHYGVGVSHLVKVGESVDARQPLMRLHAQSDSDLAAVAELAASAVTLGDSVPTSPLIYDTLL